MKTKYPKGSDGEALRVNLSNNDIHLACCDCGKVHRIQFHRVKKDIWDFAFFADNRATSQLRRHKYGKYTLNSDLFDKYKEAGFDSLDFFGILNQKERWVCGFFCQAKGSLLNDGLTCYLPLQLKSNKIREKHLAKVFDSPDKAIIDSYNKWKKAITHN